jgi:hypothetical protein
VITVKPVSATADFDFDRLYADSYADMAAGSYPWPESATDEAQKKQYFTNWLDANLSDTTNFHGMVVCVDDVDMIYFTLWLTGDVAYIQCALVAYDENGSKAYHAADPFKSAWQAYVLGLPGVDKIGVFMVKDSPIRQVVMDVYSIPESAMELYGDDCERGIMPDAQQ